MAYAMKGSPMQRNFGIGVANATGISGLTTKDSPMNWAWLIGAITKAASAVGGAALKAGGAVVKGAGWLTGGGKTMLGRALQGAGKNLLTKGGDLMAKFKGKGLKAVGKGAIKKFKGGKIGKHVGEALDPKEMAKGALTSAVMGMGRETGDAQQPPAPNLASDYSTGVSGAKIGAGRRDNIAGASGLTYKYSPIKNRVRGGVSAKKSKVVTTRGKNTITKSKDGKTSTYTVTSTKKNRDGSKTVTYTNKLGNKITEIHGTPLSKKQGKTLNQVNINQK